jgi:MFS family permease
MGPPGWPMAAHQLASAYGIFVAVAQAPWQILAIQVLDGVAQGLFIVLAAAWMTDRLADHKRVGEAQVLVGSALVAGSAIGPSLSGLVVEGIGYRGMFWLMAGIGTVATLLVVVFVPESFKARLANSEAGPLRETGLRPETDAAGSSGDSIHISLAPSKMRNSVTRSAPVSARRGLKPLA